MRCDVCWTKFETISSKIQMIKTIKKDSAGQNNLSEENDLAKSRLFSARRMSLGMNAGGFRNCFFF